jgi:hypothetical protein
LIYLPTTSVFKADVSVHESQLAKLKVGLPVRITVQAIPGKSYWGRVATISPMPDAQSMWMNPDLKVYRTEIHLQGDAQGLRTGMGCEAQIIVDEFEDVVSVPVQAVVRVAGAPTVYLTKGGKVEPRTVELGLDNNRMAHILSGLEAGDEVLLAPPLSDSEAASDQEMTPEVPELAAIPERPAPTAGGPAEAAPPAAGAQGPGMMGGPGMGAFANMTDEQKAEMRKQFEERMKNMSDEDRAKMEEARKNMTPEMRKRMEGFMNGGGGGGGRRGGGQAAGGPQAGGNAPAESTPSDGAGN